MTNAAILTDISAGIGTLTLNKPQKLNAWDTPMRAEISAVLHDWNKQAAVRAIILTGAEDRAFSAGQDLDETEKFKSGSDGANWFHSWRSFYEFDPRARQAVHSRAQWCGSRIGVSGRHAHRREGRASAALASVNPRSMPEFRAFWGRC